LSTTAITDILDAYGDAMSRDIRNRLEHINEFSVMADECTNFNGGEMTSVCVRMLTVGKVVEVFLGCYPLTSTKCSASNMLLLQYEEHRLSVGTLRVRGVPGFHGFELDSNP